MGWLDIFFVTPLLNLADSLLTGGMVTHHWWDGSHFPTKYQQPRRLFQENDWWYTFIHSSLDTHDNCSSIWTIFMGIYTAVITSVTTKVICWYQITSFMTGNIFCCKKSRKVYTSKKMYMVFYWLAGLNVEHFQN